MSRVLAVALAAVAVSPVRADDAPPERLLSPTTQFYLRWDGITPHAAAYRASAWGPLLDGPTGDIVAALLDKIPKEVGSTLLADPLLEGRPLAELRAVHADMKRMTGVPKVVADHGLMLGVEVKPPRPSVGGLVRAVGGLLGGDGGDAARKGGGNPLVPEVQAFAVVPDAGPGADAIFAVLDTVARRGEARLVPFAPADGKRGTHVVFDKGGTVHAACWMEGPHFVAYLGTVPVDLALKDVESHAKAGGVTGHPLFQRAKKIDGFEGVARGFVDAGLIVDRLKAFVAPFVPGLNTRVDDLGLGNLRAVVWASGFNGKEARALYEIDLPGQRKGLAKLLQPRPFALKELPPLPPDCSRFSALRVDWPAAYDGGVNLIEALLLGDNFGVEDEKRSAADTILDRRAFLKKELDKAAGISVADDLLPHLSGAVVAFQSPTEGLQAFGQCLAVGCKDPEAVRAAADRLQRAADALTGGRMKVRRATYAGVEMRTVYTRDAGPLAPTYAVVGDWLVVAGHPQPVQGFILRHKGELPSWKPDAPTAARLARLPADAVGLQVCDPKSTAANMCCVGPLFLTLVGRFNRGDDADPLDLALVPNAHELNRHLFPNLVATRDDGKTVRVEVSESVSLPLDCVGFDAFIFAIATGVVR